MLLMRPSAFPYCHPLWNTSPKKEGVHVSPISVDFAHKLVSMATSLEQSGNKYQIKHLHQHVYTTPENLVKIGRAVSEISLLQAIVKKEK